MNQIETKRVGNRGVLCAGLFAMLLASGLAGCVHGKDVDADDVYRLQQAMLARIPQERSEDGLGPYLPIGPSVPSLDEVTDPQTGKKSVLLTLDQAIVRALMGNTDIAIVAFSPSIARQRVIQAAAAFDYTIYGSIGYASDDSPKYDRLGSSSLAPVSKTKTYEFGVRQKTITGAEWSLSNTMIRSWDSLDVDSQNRWYSNELALQVTQPLLRGAWPDVNLGELRIARLTHKVSLSEFRTKVESVVASVATAYWQLAQARENVVILERLLEATKKSHQALTVRAEQGVEVSMNVEVRQSLAALKSREAALVEARKAAEDAQDVLARLLADPQLNVLSGVEIVPSTDLPESPITIDAADQLMTALRLNPVLEQLRLGVQQQDISVRIARNNMLPKLEIQAGVSLAGGSRINRNQVWEDVTSGDYLSYEAMLVFEYPLGNRLRKSQLTESILQRRQVLAQYQNTADQLAQQIRERIRQIGSRYEEVAIQQEALDANRKYLEGLQQREEGVTITSEWLNLKLSAQASVASSEQAVLAARVDYMTALWDLWTLTGSVLEMNQVQLALPVVSQAPLRSTPTDDAP